MSLQKRLENYLSSNKDPDPILELARMIDEHDIVDDEALASIIMRLRRLEERLKVVEVGQPS